MHDALLSWSIPTPTGRGWRERPPGVLRLVARSVQISPPLSTYLLACLPACTDRPLAFGLEAGHAL
ncbi:MAG: hypothetical protein IMW90_19205 [Thermogemmatispora sp.]|nr:MULTISPECIES: hypothetical protein [Thermogemmatispora]MBE3567851.1 hypothetical protein [Thermogemmatispora sp.]